MKFAPLVLLLLAGCTTYEDHPLRLEARQKLAEFNAPWPVAVPQPKESIKAISKLDEVEALVLSDNWLRAVLKDYGSAKIRWGELVPSRTEVADKIFLGQELSVEVNARNGFGGYSGYQRFRFVFFNRMIVMVLDDYGAVRWTR